jgi:hypothetical protein
MKLAHLSFTALLLFTFFGCSSEPKKTTTENKPAEPKPAFQNQFLTGREALQKMYIQARAWAPDAKPYSLISQPTAEANGQDGKSGIWSAGFASPSRRGVKVFAWSGINSDFAPQPGISATPEDTYNPANPSTQIFDMAFLKEDSTKASEVAKEHGGDKLLKKDPETREFYRVEWNPRENKLYWHVAFGPDRNQTKLRIAADASTGAFIRVEK